MLPPLFTRCAIGQRLAIILAIAVVILPDAALAQTPLTKATVTSFRNQVKLLPRNQPARSAQVSDQVKPGDGLATARSARADLRFNDGSLARIGQQVVFRFTSGARNFDLSNGTLLLLIPPGQGQTRVSTPNAVTGIQGSALFIRYDPATAVTTVGSLTDSGIQVWNRDQTESRILKAGQLLVVAQGPLPQPVSFDLATFYQTSALAGDLHLNDAKFSDGDTALGQVRSETVAGVAAQTLAAQDQSAPRVVPLANSPADGFFADRATNSTLRSRPSATVPPVIPPTIPAILPPPPESEVTRPVVTIDATNSTDASTGSGAGGVTQTGGLPKLLTPTPATSPIVIDSAPKVPPATPNAPVQPTASPNNNSNNGNASAAVVVETTNPGSAGGVNQLSGAGGK